MVETPYIINLINNGVNFPISDVSKIDWSPSILSLLLYEQWSRSKQSFKTVVTSSQNKLPSKTAEIMSENG